MLGWFWRNKSYLFVFFVVFIVALLLVVPTDLDKVFYQLTKQESKDTGFDVVGATFNNTDNLGWELLDNSTVIHAWNTHNDYYFNNSNGVQFSNHYNEYWTHNVMMLGYYSGDIWNLLYRTDELSGFNRDFEGETDDYMNLTLWRDLSYASYDFRLAIRYHLKINDSDLTIIPYIKNLGIAIPFQIGFGWEMKDIRIASVTNDNYLRIFNGTGFEDILLNQTLDRSFTDMGLNTTINLICTNPPSPYLSRNLYLRWNENLTYKVTCKNRTNQYNAPVTLFIKVGSLAVNQEKSTLMYWLDADDWLGISSSELAIHCGDSASGVSLDDALDGTEFWVHAVREKHHFILDLGNSYNIKKFRGRSNMPEDPVDIEIYISTDNSTWGVAVASNIATWQDTSNWVEVDSTDKTGRYIKVEIEGTEEANPNGNINWGYDLSPFTIFDAYGEIVITNNAPTIGCVYPTNESTGISQQPTCHIWANDTDADTYLNVTFQENTTGSYVIRQVNDTLSGNTSCNWTFTQADDYNTNYYWKVTADDGTDNISGIFEFTTESNTPPTIGCIYPTNTSTGISKTPTCWIVVNDTNGDNLNITFQENTTGSWVTRQTNNSVAAGSHHNWTYAQASIRSTKYWWKVWVDDGTDNISGIFEFTTKVNTPPSYLLQLTPSLIGGYNYMIWEHDSKYCVPLANQFDQQSGTVVYWINKTTGTLQYTYNQDLPDVFNDFFYINYNDWIIGNIPIAKLPYNNTFVNLNPKLGIYVKDDDGDTLTVQFLTNVSGNWTSISTNTSISPNTFVQCLNITGINEYNTTYWIRCNISDGENVTSTTQSFITMKEPSRGSILVTNVFPWNNSINISLQPTLKININHTKGHTMNISWYYGNNGTAMTNLFNTTTNVTNGTYYMINHYVAQHYNQEYGWKVVVDEGDFNVSRIYFFTCADQVGGGARSPMVAMTMGIGFTLLIFVLLIGYIESNKKKEGKT